MDHVGEQFEEVPPVFEEAKEKLKDNIKRWGYLPTKEDYYSVLQTEIDIVVSTTDHEFFG